MNVFHIFHFLNLFNKIYYLQSTLFIVRIFDIQQHSLFKTGTTGKQRRKEQQGDNQILSHYMYYLVMKKQK